MKQVLRKGLKDIVVGEVPDPVVSSGHVLIRPVCSLISSGTETASIHTEGVMKEVADNPSHLQKLWNVMKATDPMATVAEVRAKFNEYAILGYAGAGVVIDKHPGITDLPIGARVAYGGEGTGHGEAILTGRNLTARVPDEVPFEDACFATLGSIAMHAVRTAQVGLGDNVVVIGLGLVGQLVAQLARAQGAVVTGLDLKTERTKMAQQLGAHNVIPAGVSPREGVLGLTHGTGADCVIVAAAAKSAAPAQLALELVRDRGRIVVVGAVGLEFPWNDMYLKEVQLLLSRAYGPGSYDPNYEKKGQDYPLPYVRWTENRNMEEVLRLIARGQLNVKPLVSHRFPLDSAPQAYSTILDPASGSLAVVLDYPAAGPAEQWRAVRKIDISSAGTPKSGDIRFGLLGAGNLAKWAHLPNLQKTPGARLRGVCSASGARGKSYGERFGAEYCTSDEAQIFNDKDIDALVIVTRNQHHYRQSKAALEGGKHVFVEKPMALTEEESIDLCHVVEKTGRQLTVGFNRRFAPYYRDVKNTLVKRTGSAVVQCRINSPGISGSYWMADPEIGGAILGEACHFIDLMYWLVESEPLEVFAYSLPVSNTEPVGENNIVACFRFADGSIGNLTYCTVGSKTSGGERVEVYAPGLGANTEDFKRVNLLTSSRRTQSRWFAEKGYGEQIQTFVKSIQAGKPDPSQVSVFDGARSTIGCLRMLESARTGKPQKLHNPTESDTLA